MQTMRRAALSAMGLVATLPTLTYGQSFPSRPVKMIVPWPAGGLVDILARAVATSMQQRLGQNIVVENRVGAGGMIGAQLVKDSPPDGYTIALTTSALNMGAALQQNESQSATAMFKPIGIAAYAPSILLVHPSVPAKDVRSLIEVARRTPGGMSYASAGPGSPAHFAGELFGALAGVQMVHVPYKGAPAAIIDQIAGLVPVQFANAAVALPHIRSGKLRALAVTSAKRWSVLPDLPTLDEAGVKGFEADQWLGLLAPPATPDEIVVRINAALAAALAEASLKSQLAEHGMEAASPSSAASFRAYLTQDFARWLNLAKAAGIKAQ
jgi:tripartite-type tricarboxylate transporter receptor subunit TctC